MKNFLALALAIPLFGQTGYFHFTGLTVLGAGSTQTNFNTISTTFDTFDPTTITGLPMCGGHYCLGSQGGDFVSSCAYYYPWAVLASLPHGVMLWQCLASGAFHDKASWNWYDMQANPSYVSTCPSTSTYCPTAFNSAIVVGSVIYGIPGEKNPFPVFFRLDTSTGAKNDSSYSFVNGTSGITGGPTQPGWATGVYVSPYIYIAPTVDNTFVLRHDTSLDSSGYSTSGWDHLNLSACSAASSFLGSVYDGNRYIYFIPGSGKSVIVQLDTQGAFSCASVSSLDMTNIGTNPSLYPAATGNGKAANLVGMGGGAIALVGNTTTGTQKLCVIPWAYRTESSETVNTTIACVPVGSYSSLTWSAINPFATTSTWEIFDLSTLGYNFQFATNGWLATPGRLYRSGALSGQSTLGGYGLGSSSGTYGCITVFAEDAQFYLEWNCNGHDLNDSTGWYLGLIDSSRMGNNNYGGAFTGTVLYPSSPTPITYGFVQVSGL